MLVVLQDFGMDKYIIVVSDAAEMIIHISGAMTAQEMWELLNITGNVWHDRIEIQTHD